MKGGVQEVLLGVLARRLQALSVGGSVPKARGPGKQGKGGRRLEERAGGRCREGRAAPRPRGGGRGGGVGRPTSSSEPDGRETKRRPSVWSLGNCPALVPFAAGNSWPGCELPSGAEGLFGRGALPSVTPLGIGLRAGTVGAAGPPPHWGLGPGPWRPGGAGLWWRSGS